MLEADPDLIALGGGEVRLHPPRHPHHGDYATSIALDAPRRLGRDPMEVAERLATVLRGDPDLAAVTVSPPGFVNLLLAPEALHEWLRQHLLHVTEEAPAGSPVASTPASSPGGQGQALARRHAWLSTQIRYAAAGRPLDRSELSPSALSGLDEGASLELVRVLLRHHEPPRPEPPGRDLHDAVVVADAFDRYYSACRIVTDDPARTRARVWLAESVRCFVFNSLSCNGFDAPLRM